MIFSSMHTWYYTYSNRLCLSGTPLNESLITLHQILPKFQKENKLQKVQCIILTDGEANQLPRHVEIKRSLDAEPYMGLRSIYPDSSFLRDRKLGRTYRFDYGYEKFTDTLLNNLKDNFPSVNFIGIRVLGGRDANRFISLHHNDGDDEYIRLHKDWKKLRSFTIKNFWIRCVLCFVYLLVWIKSRSLKLMKVPPKQRSNLLLSNLLKLKN